MKFMQKLLQLCWWSTRRSLTEVLKESRLRFACKSIRRFCENEVVRDSPDKLCFFILVIPRPTTNGGDVEQEFTTEEILQMLESGRIAPATLEQQLYFARIQAEGGFREDDQWLQRAAIVALGTEIEENGEKGFSMLTYPAGKADATLIFPRGSWVSRWSRDGPTITYVFLGVYQDSPSKAAV